MAYPYVTDLLNTLFGTNVHLPLPTFGAVVVVAIVVATAVVRREAQRLELLGSLPPSTS